MANLFRKNVDLKKIRKHRKARKRREETSRTPLIVNKRKTDVQFNMNVNDGMWKGMMTSDMAMDHEGRKLLRWILKKDFDEEAQEIIQAQLEILS